MNFTEVDAWSGIRRAQVAAAVGKARRHGFQFSEAAVPHDSDDSAHARTIIQFAGLARQHSLLAVPGRRLASTFRKRDPWHEAEY